MCVCVYIYLSTQFIKPSNLFEFRLSHTPPPPPKANGWNECMREFSIFLLLYFTYTIYVFICFISPAIPHGVCRLDLMHILPLKQRQSHQHIFAGIHGATIFMQYLCSSILWYHVRVRVHIPHMYGIECICIAQKCLNVCSPFYLSYASFNIRRAFTKTVENVENKNDEFLLFFWKMSKASLASTSHIYDTITLGIRHHFVIRLSESCVWFINGSSP